MTGHVTHATQKLKKRLVKIGVESCFHRPAHHIKPHPSTQLTRGTFETVEACWETERSAEQGGRLLKPCTESTME
ncbi:hypothetical protein VZT92_023711 [Zoarces viviparus]|uniref:Uncharacterized protein n=1 Tax=Zoarces viviparus TaxID=48416 RepID=A0AAW1E7R2_ZOAVI